MGTRAEAVAVEQAIKETGQHIIDLESFDIQNLRVPIEHYLRNYMPRSSECKEWHVERSVYKAAIGAAANIICSTAIADGSAVVTIDEQQTSGLDSWRQFEASTSDLYNASGEMIAVRANDPGNPYFQGGNLVLDTQRRLYNIKANPAFDPAKEGCRLWIIFPHEPGPQVTGDTLTTSLKANALGNTEFILLARALAHTIATRASLRLPRNYHSASRLKL